MEDGGLAMALKNTMNKGQVAYMALKGGGRKLKVWLGKWAWLGIAGVALYLVFMGEILSSLLCLFFAAQFHPKIKRLLHTSEKKQSSDWLIAANHWFTAGFLASVVARWLIIYLLVMAMVYLFPEFQILALLFSPRGGALLALCTIPLSLWLGVRYSARNINKKYVIRDSNKIIKIALAYLVLFWLVVYPYFWDTDSDTINRALRVIALVVGAAVFYTTSKKHIKNT